MTYAHSPFTNHDWRGVHYGTYLLLRILEVILWILGSIGTVASLFVALSTENNSLGKKTMPNLGFGLQSAVTAIVTTFVFVILIRLLAAFVLRRSVTGYEDLLEGDE